MALAANVLFVYVFMPYTKIHFFICINKFKVIQRRSHTSNSFLFSYLLLCYQVYVRLLLNGLWFLFSESHGLPQRSVLENSFMFPIKLSGYFKIPTLEITIFLGMTLMHVYARPHRHFNKNSK